MHKLYVGERTTRAFARFEREADAAKSIDELDGFVMNGTPIRIRWAKAYAPKGQRGWHYDRSPPRCNKKQHFL